MKTGPKVVALVPAWKAAAFIEETLQSLAAQTYGNLSVLISDDASPDNTYEVCLRFAEGRPDWKVIRQPTNLGWIGNSNFLLGEADGEFCFWAFHDDILKPAFVEALVGAIQNRKEAVIAFCDMTTLDETNTSVFCPYPHMDEVHDAFERGWIMASRRGYFWSPNRGIFRVSTARHVGGLRMHWGGNFSADWVWLLAFALRGDFVRVPEALVLKRLWRASLSAGWEFTRRQRIGSLKSALETIHRSPLPLYPCLRLDARLIALTIRRGLGRVLGGGEL